MKTLLLIGALTLGLNAFASGGGGGGTTPLSDMIQTQTEKEVVKTKKTIVLTEDASLELLEALGAKNMKGKINCKTTKASSCPACDDITEKPVCKITTATK